MDAFDELSDILNIFDEPIYVNEASLSFDEDVPPETEIENIALSLDEEIPPATEMEKIPLSPNIID